MGGSDAHSLLGLGGDAEAELVAFGDRTRFWRRRTDAASDPEIQGYVWGGLTSGSKLQPFWLLLLPFTLVNVAGWMHDPKLGSKRVSSIRAITFLFGLTLTATYLLWAVAMIEDSAGAKWLSKKRWTVWHFDWRLTPRWCVLLGAAVIVILLIGLAILAFTSGRAVSTNKTADGSPRVGDSGKRSLVGVAVTTRESLVDDPEFFRRRRDARRLLAVHVGWTLVVLAVVTAFAYAWATADAVTIGSEEPTKYLQWSFGITGTVQGLLFVLLFCLSVKWKTKDEPHEDTDSDEYWPVGRPRRRFRWAGPAIACALAVMFANLIFAGASRTLDDRLGVDVGHTFLLADVLVMTLLFFVLAAMLWAVWYRVLFPDVDALDFPPEIVGEPTNGPGQPANGAAHSIRKNTARFRGLTRGVTRLDLPLSYTAIAFFLAAAAFTIARWKWGRDAWRVPAFAVAGTKLVVWVGAGLIFLLYAKRNDPKLKKTVGIIWDLLTFWPRRFHPFAVRPYSAQAVPELRGRITGLLDDPKHARLILSVHSQGTVLSFAAIAPLDATYAKRVAYVSYGSHLGGLFRVFFPAYFSHDAMEEVHGKVESWHNFRRRTDPIASDIHTVNTNWLDSPDVTVDPVANKLRVKPTLAEVDRDRWIKVETHSYYRSEPLLKRLVDDLRVGPVPDDDLHAG